MSTFLIVEDGSMPAGANSFASVEQAAAYTAQRGPFFARAFAEADDTAKKAALVRAADLLNTLAWKGVRMTPERMMAWPRKGMRYEGGAPVPENRVPGQICRAACELAAWLLRDGAQADPLAPVATDRGPIMAESVDVLSIQYASPEDSRYSGATGYPAVDALLRPFLRGRAALEEASVSTRESGRG